MRQRWRLREMPDVVHDVHAVRYCTKFPFTVTRESQVSRAAFTFTVNHM